MLILVFGGAAAIAYALFRAQGAWTGAFEIAAYSVDNPSDAAALERGRYLFSTRGCVDCHGADGAGRVFVDDGSMRIKGPNISPARATWSPATRRPTGSARIRHGVKPDGRPLLIMPSEDYNRFTDDDLGALVAYVRQLPPRPAARRELVLPLPLRALYGLGEIPDAASKIDHTRRPRRRWPRA